MDNFKLFDEMLSLEILKNDIEGDNSLSSCDHINIIDIKNAKLCEDCGKELSSTIIHEKEWRYYGAFDSKSSDPNRVQARKNDDRNIYKDVEMMGFSDKIVANANDLYILVTKGKIKRGNSRKSIIFACIFQSYKLNDTPQTHERLIKMFNLNRKSGLQGLKYVSLNAPKTSHIHTVYITPIHLVKDIMDKFYALPKHIAEVVNIYENIKNKDTILNRARPISVASGIVYWWITHNNREVSIKEFTSKVALSELTITRMAKLVNLILLKEDMELSVII